eukprot:2491794-Ditylum_brightwellii.AAC.1
MAATTQYAKNVMHLPMRHFKSCFPALCVCWIDESKPHQQNQNSAERCIQEVKAMANLAHEQLGWLTPISVTFGYTPD